MRFNAAQSLYHGTSLRGLASILTMGYVDGTNSVASGVAMTKSIERARDYARNAVKSSDFDFFGKEAIDAAELEIGICADGAILRFSAQAVETENWLSSCNDGDQAGILAPSLPTRQILEIQCDRDALKRVGDRLIADIRDEEDRDMASERFKKALSEFTFTNLAKAEDPTPAPLRRFGFVA